jgi:hypothetical protein
LPPAPPTPITLILVPPDAFSTISNIYLAKRNCTDIADGQPGRYLVLTADFTTK